MARERTSASTMHRSERISAILERLACGGTVNAVDVAKELGVSVATIRRDLSLLDEQNLLIRTHGGAVGRTMAHEVPVCYREGKRRAAKQAIARMAMRCMTSGQQVVAINGGSTTAEVARLLATWTDLTVVTNALNVAAALVNKPRLKLVVTGGVARPNSYELVGPMAEGAFGRLNIDTAFIGIDGINAATGLSTYDTVEAQINALMISRARRVVVVADGSKIGRNVLAHVADLRLVNELVTDSTADSEELAAIAAWGVRVTIAEPGGRGTRPV